MVSEAANGKPEAQILATGSEVQLAVAAQKATCKPKASSSRRQLAKLGFVRETIQSIQRFRHSSGSEKRLAIEMAYPFGWERYVGDEGSFLVSPHSAHPHQGIRVIKEYGFTVENVVSKVKALL